MITKMKKLSVLLYHGQKDSFMSAMQSLGNVHIIETPEKDTSGLRETETFIKRADLFVKHIGSPTVAATRINGSDSPDDRALAAIERFEKLEAEKNATQQALQRCRTEETQLLPWGEFDPETLKALAGRDVFLRFFKSKTAAFDKIDKSNNPVTIISRTPVNVYFVMVTRDLAAIEIDAEESRLPDRALSAIRMDAAIAGERLLAIETAMRDFSDALHDVRVFDAEQKTRYRFLSAQLDLNSRVNGKILELRGYFPAKERQKVEAVLRNYIAWYSIENPTTADDVPVKLSNGPLSRLFEPIMKLYMLPSYWELDPTPFFAPFFAFFVGLCLGDVGYGALILIGAAIIYRKAPASTKPMAGMGIVLGAMIVFAGLLLNSFFGVTLFSGKGIPAGTALLDAGLPFLAPPPLAAVETPKGTLFPAMSFSILIAIVQLSFAMLLQAANKLRLGGIIPAISPIAMLLLFQGGLVCMTHTNFGGLGMADWTISSWRVGAIWESIPLIAGAMIMFTGLALYFSVGHDDDKIAGRFGWRLFDFYNFVTGMLGNVLSYVRLFALGLCGGSLAFTVNSIALGFITKNGETDWLSPMAIATVLLLVVGHAFNFALSLIGAFVHPIRLTFVEFLGTLQFTGGGKPYAPFEKVKAE